jgi:hypothetical protein
MEAPTPAQTIVTYPVLYAHCGTMKLLLSGFADEKGEEILAPILNRVETALHGNGAENLRELNRELFFALASLFNKAQPKAMSIAKIGMDHFMPMDGGLSYRLLSSESIIKKLTQEQRLAPRPASTQETAQAAYPFPRSVHSHNNGCSVCSYPHTRSFKCIDLPVRPEFLDGPEYGEGTWVRPQDAVKVALYHNLITMYTFFFFMERSKPSYLKITFETRARLQVTRWGAVLFPKPSEE